LDSTDKHTAAEDFADAKQDQLESVESVGDAEI